MREFFLGNARLKLLSLVLAMLAWGYLRFIDNPLLPNTSTRKLMVPIAITGLSPGETVELDAQNASITMARPFDLTTDGDRPRVVVDLRSLGAGRHYVPLQVFAASSAVTTLEPGNVSAVITEGNHP